MNAKQLKSLVLATDYVQARVKSELWFTLSGSTLTATTHGRGIIFDVDEWGGIRYVAGRLITPREIMKLTMYSGDKPTTVSDCGAPSGRLRAPTFAPRGFF